MRSALVFPFAGALALAFACEPIQGAPLPGPPTNSGCPEVRSCAAYDAQGAKTKAQCNQGRCEYGRPDYPFTMVVSVPDSSLYAPGRTFVLSSADLNPQSGVEPQSSCVLPTCVQLPELNLVQGQYKVTPATAKAVGYPTPLADDTSLPVRVSYIPLIEAKPLPLEAVSQGIPLETVLTSSRSVRTRSQTGGTTNVTTEVQFVEALPVGLYQRIAYPEPPFDQYFPPIVGQKRVNGGAPNTDDLTLGTAQLLDDPSGMSRTATVSRPEGLDGWQVWLADGETGRRISSIRTLAGTTMSVRLDTVTPTGTLGGKVDVIVAPPTGWLGVPRLQSALVNGQGFERLDVPSLPAPATVGGVVAHGEPGALIGIQARLSFSSTRLRLGDGQLQPLLHYSTTVSTDEKGNFKTVIPPGVYEVTVEPVEGTSFAKVKETFDTDENLAKTYRPPPRTIARGRVRLADGRPLSHTDVLAVPSETALVSTTAVKPRPARTRTGEDGVFTFEADQGQYDLVVEPQAGTGFPRFVQLRTLVPGTADLGDFVIGPPARLAFKLREPNQPNTSILNPIVRAVVRIFAEAPGAGPPAVEIGRAITDADGNCEILLPQQPR